MSVQILQIHPLDNVAVALCELQAGDCVHGSDRIIKICEHIPTGHKIALTPLLPGENVIKYANPIGHATTVINAGAWVHTHNLATNLGEMLTYSYDPILNTVQSSNEKRTFSGYPRANDSVGIRNEIWILPTVGCVNQVTQQIATVATARWKTSNIDGIYAFPHPYGCSQLGEDHNATRQILIDLTQNPNAGAVLVVGLGCENNHISAFKEALSPYDPQRIAFLNCQDVSDEVDEGLRLMENLVAFAAASRQPVPVAKLVVGLKCGGSDAFSGITANPLVGEFSDRLVAHGGTSILTEVPEMFGAEHLLMQRCRDQATFEKMVEMINGFKAYFIQHQQVIYDNPSPGNKEGGITTLEEKSLGCTQKAGTSPIVDVLPYAQRVTQSGVNLLNGPGNDMVAATALVASGAQLMLFTTGRGTPLGAPIPTVKIATNTQLATRKARWIDFNAGSLLEGANMDEVAAQLFELVLAVASGQQTKNEEHDFREITIWKDGVTL